ncbi:succinate dehydrogenase flavoprotein subunit [Ketogulonicigenium vulgare]|uniref:Succinate dehydrogenase flavoprotein subunit n=1 Tax=Ketogulonicigenium vulgare (strain WSH-001) TaxID=759362 RepID=F9Y7K6_KETVW|nr:succinate dehydrogenase flavoprotein subunit [Ketogulonicigenium vulgare]ADO41313.1 succinate dehydrogenase flavoprotein subunit [Ketogulonicigenium vulgare Y25]AEM42302.1 Succinate dehydrogenase flavoprotein subunit [Ketogulonicigenium vulgare WSH-001]ALJ79919.1 succinate dehydrogenase [Ketogulonicigenium vulgare]ANW34835.1 succinate dehydrogenase [Ketogulonicigenium vulgare]AOZ53139.1 succinate dehydrogenase flavoprotein subunit [Ketogulonicigenium vulgare]
MKYIVLFTAFAGLAGCIGQDTVTDASRVLAKEAVNNAVAARAPGINVAPVTDCIIDNANGSELLVLATGAVTGTVSAETSQLVRDIATRRGTQNCLLSNMSNAGLLSVMQGALS